MAASNPYILPRCVHTLTLTTHIVVLEISLQYSVHCRAPCEYLRYDDSHAVLAAAAGRAGRAGLRPERPLATVTLVNLFFQVNHAESLQGFPDLQA